MGIEENKEVIRKMYEGQNKRDDTYYDYLAPGCVFHTNIGDLQERRGDKSSEFIDIFDTTSTIDKIVAEGDMVAFQVTYRGTHKGEFMGIAPTGNPIKMTVNAIYQIVDGKVVEGSSTLDMLGLLQQIGAVPRLNPNG